VGSFGSGCSSGTTNLLSNIANTRNTSSSSKNKFSGASSIFFQQQQQQQLNEQSSTSFNNQVSEEIEDDDASIEHFGIGVGSLTINILYSLISCLFVVN
jgi:flagellar basal body rod protein FlgC